MKSETLDIMIEDVYGNIFKAFTWIYDEKSGIARAKKDIQYHNIEVKRIWAKPSKNR